MGANALAWDAPIGYVLLTIQIPRCVYPHRQCPQRDLNLWELRHLLVQRDVERSKRPATQDQ